MTTVDSAKASYDLIALFVRDRYKDGVSVSSNYFCLLTIDGDSPELFGFRQAKFDLQFLR